MVRPGHRGAQDPAAHTTARKPAGHPADQPAEGAAAERSSGGDGQPPHGGPKALIRHWRERADPLVRKAVDLRAVRAWQHYTEHQGNNLAGAVTYFGFLSLFPLIVLAAAITASLLGPGQVRQIKDTLNRNLPGLADKIDLDPIIANAGAIGVVGAAALLLTGLGWVAATRSALRTTYELPIRTDNAVVGKIKDAGALVGLGVVMLFSVAASALGSALSSRLLQAVGLGDTTAGAVLLGAGAILLATGTNFVLFMYLLVGFPRYYIRRREAVSGALIGAIGFELLKAAVSSYISGVAAKSTYGAFGVPIALLVWINLVARLLLLCAAWTAQSRTGGPVHHGGEAAEGTGGTGGSTGGAADTTAAAGTVGPTPPRSPDPSGQGGAPAAGAALPRSAADVRGAASVARRRLGALLDRPNPGSSLRGFWRGSVRRT